MPPAWQPKCAPTAAVDAGPRAAPAAVLVPLVAHGASVQVLLTQRTDHLHDHAGQISFPEAVSRSTMPIHGDRAARSAGGGGLPAERVEIIGSLPRTRRPRL